MTVCQVLPEPGGQTEELELPLSSVRAQWQPPDQAISLLKVLVQPMVMTLALRQLLGMLPPFSSLLPPVLMLQGLASGEGEQHVEAIQGELGGATWEDRKNGFRYAGTDKSDVNCDARKCTQYMTNFVDLFPFSVCAVNKSPQKYVFKSQKCKQFYLSLSGLC